MKMFDIRILCTNCNQWHCVLGNSEEVKKFINYNMDNIRQIIITDEVLAIESDLDAAELITGLTKL